jgi:hypothetical protein
MVYDRDLKETATAGGHAVTSLRNTTYPSRANGRQAEFLALASLCHVLLNTNEFVYID